MAPSKQYDEGGQLQLMEADRVEEEEECFEAIDKLISQGINAGDVKKLQDAGIYTCNGLMMHTKKSLTGIKGLSEAKVDKICEAAEKLLTQGFMTGSDLLIKRKSVVRITTGSQALDELLGGAIETPITEAFGEFRGMSRMAPSKQYDEDMQVQHRQAYRVDEECFQSIDKLISRSIRAGDVKKLHAAGIHTCNDLSTCSKKMLGEIKGFSEAKIDIILSASKKLVIEEYDKGSDLLINGNSVKWIRTANEAFEAPLCGNPENHPTIHSIDKFRPEKTRLTHSLCVTSQMDMKDHKFKSKVVYIDTLGLFNPNRIISIAENLGIDGASILENVVHEPADSFEKIEQLSTNLADKISEEPFSLLILPLIRIMCREETTMYVQLTCTTCDSFFGPEGVIDSVTPLLSTGEGNCQKKLNHLLVHLAYIADKYNIAVYITKRERRRRQIYKPIRPAACD